MKTETESATLETALPTVAGAISIYKADSSIEQFKVLFTSSAEVMLRALTKFSKLIKSSGTPLTEMLKVDITHNAVAFSGTDLTSTMKTVLTVPTKGSGTFYINYKQLNQYLKAVKIGALVFVVDENMLTIIRDGSSYKIAIGGEPDEMPEIENMPNCFTLTSNVLRSGLKKTVLFTGKDELKPVFNGVYLQAVNNEFIFTATDACKLACYRFFDSCQYAITAECKMNIPSNACKLIIDFFDGNDMVNVSTNGETAIFKRGKDLLQVRLIDGKYPDYSAVIPKKHTCEIRTNRVNLIGIIDRLMINKNTYAIKLSNTTNGVNLSANDTDFQIETTEKLNCDCAGEFNNIGFNGKFLRNVLSQQTTETVCLLILSSSSPVLIMPYELSATDDYLTLVMPIMLHE